MRWKTGVVVAISLMLPVASAWWLSAENRVPGKIQAVAKEPQPEHPAAAQSRSDKLVRVEKEITLPAAPTAFGIIRYDTTTISAFPTVRGRSYGNRFNTALTVNATAVGPVEVSGTVTALQWAMLGTTNAASWPTVFVTIYGPVNGTTAPVLTVVGLGVPARPTPFLASWNFPTAVQYSGPSFLAAMFNSNTMTAPPYNGPFPYFDANTTAGQGHHAMGIHWGPTTGTGLVDIPSYNVIMRASGNVLTPVELMSFTVE